MQRSCLMKDVKMKREGIPHTFLGAPLWQNEWVHCLKVATPPRKGSNESRINRSDVVITLRRGSQTGNDTVLVRVVCDAFVSMERNQEVSSAVVEIVVRVRCRRAGIGKWSGLRKKGGDEITGGSLHHEALELQKWVARRGAEALVLPPVAVTATAVDLRPVEWSKKILTGWDGQRRGRTGC
ncbi:hypothetical protein C8J57DRAFT_1214987 [Mycena rebaudengoi]|nr:hypothetical protein C8J57DRAFT_1214987 [Mycena rebaudengoi]